MDFVPRTIQTMVKRDTYFENGLEIYQSIRSFIVRKNLKIEKKKFFEKYLETYFENGFVKKVYRNNPPNYVMKFEKRGGKDGFVHYKGLQEYIEANTLVEALPFDKLDYLFRIYLALVTAVLFLCLVQYFAVQLAIYLIQKWLLFFVRFEQ